MEIATTNFKKYLLDAYRDLPEDISINNDGDYHLLKNNKDETYLIYIYEQTYHEYSYAVLLDDVEWHTILASKEEAE